MNVGVVIARFQIDELHQGHKDLLAEVKNENDKLVVLLGVCAPKHTTKNPLDFKTRRLMIHSEVPGSDIFPIYDKRKDEVWSNQVDDLLTKLYPGDTITLYGSRDSFIPHYKGKFATKEVRQQLVYDATSRREEVSKVDPIDSAEFRRGVIYAAYNRYASSMPTCDIAILKRDTENNTTHVLLVKKPDEDLHRFCGGFDEPDEDCFEDTAKKEVGEETGVETDNYKYVCSKRIDDWRYVGVKDKVKTLLFKCEYLFGTPKGMDDVESCKWFNLATISAEDVMPEHVYLLERLLESEKQIRITADVKHN